MTPYRPNIWMYEGDNDSHVRAWQGLEYGDIYIIDSGAALLTIRPHANTTSTNHTLQQYAYRQRPQGIPWRQIIVQGLAASKW